MPGEFWRMTVREIVWCVEAASWRQAQSMKIAKAAAWTTAALMRTRRMQALSDLLRDRPAGDLRRQQTPAQHAEIVRMLHAQLGGVLEDGRADRGT